MCCDLPWVETSTGSLGQGIFRRARHGDGPEAAEDASARLHAAGRRRIAGRRSVGSRDVRRRITSSTISAPSSTTTSCKATTAMTRSCGWSRWPPNGAPSAGRWPEIDGHDIARHSVGACAAPAPRMAARRHHRPHRQGQRRALYGKHSRLAWQREADARAGRRGADGAGRRRTTKSRICSMSACLKHPP